MFDQAKRDFRERFDKDRMLLNEAKDAMCALLNSLLDGEGGVGISKIEGRVKDREECISKFTRKYRSDLEKTGENYEIWSHVTDIVGLRVVCLYEDEVEKVKDVLSDNFTVLGFTDKTGEIEGTESEFGYKGLHVDIRLNGEREKLPEYSRYGDLRFEVQIRTIVQDSWSSIDHKIKYKKSIPPQLKRRINTLAALFELADREFREIRDQTKAEIILAEGSYEEISTESDDAGSGEDSADFRGAALNAFSFNRISNHFFPTYVFEDHKVDGFVQEVQRLRPGTTRGKFNYYLKETVSIVKNYSEYFSKKYERDELNPFTKMRHCLYLSDKDTFGDMLTQAAKDTFEEWLKITPEEKRRKRYKKN